MKTVQGDLIKMALDGRFDVILHGANCYCKMGAGIAKTIKNVFPEAYEADCQTEAGDISKLGRISFATVTRGEHEITVVNAYTQFGYGRGLQLDYDAVRMAMEDVKVNFQGQRIGYPKIGAGLAGGDWGLIYQIIDDELYDEDHTCVEFA